MTKPLIVGVGGTLANNGSSERILRYVLGRCEQLGADINCFAGENVDWPMYRPGQPLCDNAQNFIEALRTADGIVISSPSYHGVISGIVKNALDYTEEMRQDDRPYFERRPVGLIAVAGGWQGASSTLSCLRSIVHALRGWPTPFGLVINSQTMKIGPDGAPDDSASLEQCSVLASQLVNSAIGVKLAYAKGNLVPDIPEAISAE